MSSKNTKFLTKDDEHCYYDGNEIQESESGELKECITIEFDKKNIRIDMNEDDCLVLTITNVNSELYKIFDNIEKLES